MCAQQIAKHLSSVAAASGAGPGMAAPPLLLSLVLDDPTPAVVRGVLHTIQQQAVL